MATDIIPVPRACRKRIETFFEGINPIDVERYKSDWQTIMPNSDREQLNRYRFAYCTVHTSWANSCDQYNAVKKYDASITYDTLLRMLKLQALITCNRYGLTIVTCSIQNQTTGNPGVTSYAKT